MERTQSTEFISRLRRISEELGEGCFAVETIARVGYRLIAVQEFVEGACEPATLAPASPAPGAANAPTKPSIAVLPFANLSGDPEQDYFADGMVEEITTALSRDRSIFVIASGSSLSFRGKAITPQEAARQLGVRYILEGSVRKAAGRVRIAVQLIDGANGAQIWGDRFEDTLEDVFFLQDNVALMVAGKIEPTVRQAEIRRASTRPTDNMGSYDLYLRALPLFRNFANIDVFGALDLLHRAIAIDPNYGSALGFAAACHYVISLFGWSDDAEANRRRGIEMAHRALKVAGDDAYVLVCAALAVASLERDLPAAIALVEKAIALNPGSSLAWRISGDMRLRAGETDLAIEHLEKSMRLDPMGPDRPIQLVYMAVARFRKGQLSDAAALSKEFVQQTDAPTGYAILAASYGHLGQARAAREALERYQSLTPLPIHDFARAIFSDPVHLKLFLEGIALATGKGLSPPLQVTDGWAQDLVGTRPLPERRCLDQGNRPTGNPVTV